MKILVTGGQVLTPNIYEELKIRYRPDSEYWQQILERPKYPKLKGLHRSSGVNYILIVPSRLNSTKRERRRARGKWRNIKHGLQNN